MASRSMLATLGRVATAASTATPAAAGSRIAARGAGRAVGAARRLGQARTFASASPLAVKKYTEDHEWIDYDESSKIGTIGITAYAANALGDVVYVELPSEGTEVSQGDAIGAVESVKSASDILTPVAGTVTEANSSLEETPATINKSPEGDGWIAKLELSDAAELDSLMDEAAYKQFSEEAGEEH